MNWIEIELDDLEWNNPIKKIRVKSPSIPLLEPADIDAIKSILKKAIQLQGTSVFTFRRMDNKMGEFQNFLNVYGKTAQPCPKCDQPIQRIVQYQRSTFFCPQCQR